MTFLDRLDPAFAALAPRLTAWRRELHRHPERGYEEERTGAFVAETLGRLGFQVSRVAQTGVVGLWPGRDPEAPCVAFRADMDALPLQELSEHAYRSENPGVMHACGHDGHTAMLLGFAAWLSEGRHVFPGAVKLLFQPAEEGLGGARRMIAEGVLEAPKVAAIFGVHLWTPLPVGVIGSRPGPMMSSSDRFAVRFEGLAGHGGLPHLAKDALLAAASFVVATPRIVAREVNPLESAVVSVCQFHAGEADNAIPGEALVRGTTRAFTPERRVALQAALRRLAQGTAQAHDLGHRFTWIDQYPPTCNDPACYAWVREVAGGLAQAEEIAPTTAAEDFSYYLERVPGCFGFIGAGNAAKGLTASHHDPRFDFDEDVLPFGPALFAGLAERFFAEP